MVLKKELNTLANIIIILICLIWFSDFTYRITSLVLLLTIFLLTADFKQKFLIIYNDKIALSYLLLFLIFLIGLLWTEDFSHTNIILIKIAPLLFVPLIIVMYEKEYLKYMLIALFLSILYMALSTGNIFINFEELNSSLGNVSLYALTTFYGPVMGMAFVYFLSKDSSLINSFNKEKLFIKLMMYFFILVLLIICNRTAVLSFCLMFTFFSFFVLKENIKRKIGYFFLNGLVIVFLMYSVNGKCRNSINNTINVMLNLDLKTQIEEQDSSKRSSLSCRFEFWVHSFDIIDNNKAFGIGTGDGYQEIRSLMGDEAHDKMFKDCGLTDKNHFNPHNMYILMLLLFGPIGLVIIIYLIYSQIKASIKYNSKALLLSSLMLALVFMSSSIMFTSMFFITFYSLFIPIIYLIAKESKTDESFIKWK